MVTDDRGQLILVGAITIALVLLGLVLIVNTAMFTQIVGSEGTVESAKEGGVSGQEIGNAIGAVVAAENRNGGGPASIDGRVSANVSSELRGSITERRVESGGSYTNLTYEGSTTNGTLITQDSYNQLSNSSGDTPWSPVVDNDVGQFLLTVNATLSNGNQTTIAVDGARSPERTVTVSVDGDDDEVTLSGNVTEDASGDCNGIDATGGTVRIDVYHGQVYEAGGCSLDLFRGTGESFTVEYRNVGGVQATYSIATDQSFPSLYGSATGPAYSEIVWAFEYSFEYDTPGATVESEGREVEVYD